MRGKAESQLDKDSLEKFTFSLKEKNEKVEWEEAEKEFRYNGEMYDVVKIEVKKDSITYFCLHDNDEEILLSNFDKLVKNSTGNNSKSKNYNAKELSKYNFNHTNEIYLAVKEIELRPLRSVFYQSITIEIQSPPPRTI
ncbi:MAG: hypothetical protein WAM24_06425 [Ignavibacteriaceae bacterium]